MNLYESLEKNLEVIWKHDGHTSSAKLHYLSYRHTLPSPPRQPFFQMSRGFRGSFHLSVAKLFFNLKMYQNFLGAPPPDPRFFFTKKYNLTAHCATEYNFFDVQVALMQFYN